MIESLNGTFKAELIKLHGPWRTRDATEIAIIEWIDWYNAVRLHGEIGDIPPVDHETDWYPHNPGGPRGRHRLNRTARDPGWLTGSVLALALRWGGVSSGRGGGDVEIDGFLVSARTGDELGFAGLYRLLAGKVAGYVRGRGVVDVDDVVNEVFLAAFVGLGSFAGDAQAFRSWLFGIAWNKTADWHRRERRRPAEVDDAESAIAVQIGGDAEEDAWRDLGASRVEALLASLTDDQRDVLLLRVVADLSLEETARIMGRPVGPVKTLQHRALAALRRNISSGAVSK